MNQNCCGINASFRKSRSRNLKVKLPKFQLKLLNSLKTNGLCFKKWRYEKIYTSKNSNILNAFFLHFYFKWTDITFSAGGSWTILNLKQSNKLHLPFYSLQP